MDNKRITLLLLPIMAFCAGACATPEPEKSPASPMPSVATPAANASPASPQVSSSPDSAPTASPSSTPAKATKKTNQEVVRDAKKQAASDHKARKAPPAPDSGAEEQPELPEPIPSVKAVEGIKSGPISGISSEPITGLDETTPPASPNMSIDTNEVLPFLQEINACPPPPPETKPGFGGSVSPIKGIDSMQTKQIEGVKGLER